MHWVILWCPEEDWLRQQAPTLSINLTKQGYCLILVPATGVKWSTIWSTIRTPGMCHPTPQGIPYMSLTCDWVLSIVNQQHQPVQVRLDGFICAVGCGLYVCLCYIVGGLCMMPAVVTRVSRISLLQHQRGMHGPQGVYGVSIYDLCQ